MLAVLGLAVLCAIAAPYVREMSETRRWLLAGQLLAMFGTGGLVSYVMFSLRRRAERLAGGRFLIVPLPSASRSRYSTLMVVFFSIIILPMAFGFNFERSAQQIQDSSLIGLRIFNLLMLPAVYGMVLAQWLYQKSADNEFNAVELCENGLIVRTRFIPWTALRSVQWEPARGFLQWNVNRTATQADVSVEYRDRVGRVLREHFPTAHWDDAPIGSKQDLSRPASP